MRKISGLVEFEKDSTIYVFAIVTKEGIVSDLFKIELNSRPTQILPPKGDYQIVYKLNSIHFISINGKTKYVFRRSNIGLPYTKGLHQWRVKTIKWFDPDTYPWVEGCCYTN